MLLIFCFHFALTKRLLTANRETMKNPLLDSYISYFGNKKAEYKLPDYKIVILQK